MKTQWILSKDAARTKVVAHGPSIDDIPEPGSTLFLSLLTPDNRVQVVPVDLAELAMSLTLKTAPLGPLRKLAKLFSVIRRPTLAKGKKLKVTIRNTCKKCESFINYEEGVMTKEQIDTLLKHEPDSIGRGEGNQYNIYRSNQCCTICG